LPDQIIPERKVVQIDVGKKQFDKFLMKSMIRQSGFTAQEFCSGSISLSCLASTTLSGPLTHHLCY
jgi:hypothetical protein